MSLTGWIGVARVVRAQILKLRDQEFILASRTLGAGKLRLMQKHLFPNIIGQLVVMMTFTIPGAIYYEAFLTFIGMGLPIPMASLGVLLRDGYNSIQTIPAMLLIPAFIMSLLMLSINLLANGLRDALDPRMR
jgi:ABC-type dipeptide/oligopeptide/nickel transport system permease subunit